MERAIGQLERFLYAAVSTTQMASRDALLASNHRRQHRRLEVMTPRVMCTVLSMSSASEEINARHARTWHDRCLSATVKPKRRVEIFELSMLLFRGGSKKLLRV